MPGPSRGAPGRDVTLARLTSGIAPAIAVLALVVAIVALVGDDSGEGSPASGPGPAAADPAAYTQAFVDDAIRRYGELGREAAIEYFNSRESVDGEWYIFIFDENDVLVVNATIPQNVGLSAGEIEGPDGYPVGRMLAAGATEGGAWVPYTYLNPATGRTESKQSWVVRHDGLIFGSGWYVDGPPKSEPQAYTVAFVERGLALYELLGPEEAVAYYNTPESTDGPWYVFVIDGDGYTIAHPREDIRGRDPSERVDITGYFYGDDLLGATEDGRWVNYVFLNPTSGREEVKHTWAVRRGEYLFASGWYERYIGPPLSP